MTAPLISVIMPVYNHERFVEEAIMSVVRQTYRPLELIVIDDGSLDDSVFLAQRLLRTEFPGSVFIARENRGAHNTINQGLRMASGDYLTVINSDDTFHQRRLERCIKTIERTQSEFLFTDVSFIDDTGQDVLDDPYVERIREVAKNSMRFPTIGYSLLKNQIAVSTGNFIFSRRLFKLLYSFRHYRYVHDWDFILRALFFVEPYYLRENLYNYRIHGKNSFKSLSAVEGYETNEVMGNFMWLMMSRVPENQRAPCPHYWPGYFDWFIEAWQYECYMPSPWKLPFRVF